MNGVRCRIVRGQSCIYSSDDRGIAPLLELLKSGLNVHGCTAYDTVVGKAAALLYVHLGVQVVHAGVMSVSARNVFARYSIECDCETLTECIINRKGDGMCPMELAVEHVDDPAEAERVLTEKVKQLRKA